MLATAELSLKTLVTSLFSEAFKFKVVEEYCYIQHLMKG